MKHWQRFTAGFLSLALAGSLCPPAEAALETPEEAPPETPEEDVSLLELSPRTGSIALTVGFAMPQTADEVESRNLQLYLSSEADATQNSTIALPSGKVLKGSLDPDSVTVVQKNPEGVERTTEAQLGSYTVQIDGLQAEGTTYGLRLTGRGYTDFTAKVTLEDFSKHLVVSNADGSFPIGNVDDINEADIPPDQADKAELATPRNRVTEADLALMKENLGKTDPKLLEIYDLNGDGKIDVTDFAYVHYTMNRMEEAQVLQTTVLVRPALDMETVNFKEGSASELFDGDSASVVTISAHHPEEDDTALSIPMAFDETEGMELSKIVMTCPEDEGAVQSGTAEVEVVGQKDPIEIPFDITEPEGVHAIGRDAGRKVIEIPLGKKVAVKKVTIKVTRVQGQEGEKPEFAKIAQIEFLQDIVPDTPQIDVTQVRDIAASAGDGQVKLVWGAIKNITGYEVHYGEKPDDLAQSVAVTTNQAVITGLENLTTYYFQVTAVNGDWRGTPSAILSAMPEAAQVPGKPSNILVKSAGKNLQVSWGKTKDASYYQVFYRQEGETDWIQWGGNITELSTAITGLTPGTTYEVAVKAGNSKGVGEFSAIASGTLKPDGFQPPEFPTTDRINASEQVVSIALQVPSNYDTTLCPDFKVNHLIDNDANTYWIAKNWWTSSAITFTFKDPQDMNYLLLAPCLEDRYKNRQDRYSLQATDVDGKVIMQTSQKVPNLTVGNYAILAFPETKGIKTLTLSLSEKTGGPRVSISEIAFYKSDSLADDIAKLFANGSFTELQSGVTKDQIDTLEARLSAKKDFYLDFNRLNDELTLARTLLAGEAATGVVKADFQSRSTSTDSANYGQTASAFQPLGVTASAGTTIAIYAELPGDGPVSVVPTQFYGESGVWTGASIDLQPGRNYITVPKIGSLTDPRGGALYLTYGGASPADIRIQVLGANAIPTLELSNWYDLNDTERDAVIQTYVETLSAYVGKLTTSNWKTDINNATEISTPSVLLSLPADQILAGLQRNGTSTDVPTMVETMHQNVLAWEETLMVANQVQGIVDTSVTLATNRYPMTTRQNIRYMRMFAGAFMYAAVAHIGIEYGSASALAQGSPSSKTAGNMPNGLFGWGIAHEIGHNMDQLGKVEITNNIYSEALQAWDGGSMKQLTRIYNSASVRQSIFDKTATGRPGAANNVFVQLGMYWQLHLAYDEASKPLAFYNQFFQEWKNSGASGKEPYEDYGARIASKTADRNLTEFFTRWGMKLSDNVKAELSKYPAEDRAIWYFDDSNRNYRLDSGAPNIETTTATASVVDNNVTITIENSDPASIHGYEIQRNGVPIAFTLENTYLDKLGAANNRTYTYTVVPIDKLGNVGTEATINEIRVAYDKTIDASLYTTSRTDTTCTFTMTDGAVPVTGVKITSASSLPEETFSVRLKPDAAAESWITAKETAPLSGTSVVSYFNKPKASVDDTRIWTYDAAVIEVTGVPETATVELLDYPGDRIDFYDGAVAGYLKDDYHYGTGAEDVIKAGTLVILGTYRGDPVYNYVEIEASYTTTTEASEPTSIERSMNGYSLLLAEIPEDGAVSDTSDGFFLFVPDLDEEADLNQTDGVTDDLPLEIRAVFYRTNTAESTDAQRVTSETLWVSFPEEDSLPEIDLQSELQNDLESEVLLQEGVRHDV